MTPNARTLTVAVSTLAFLLAASAGALASASSPAAASPTWKTVPSPAFKPTGELVAAAAATTRQAWAVGDVFPSAGHSNGVIEHWNGQHWTIALATSPGAVSFHDVTTAGQFGLWAVGDNLAAPTAYRLSDDGWMRATAGLPASGSFTAVADTNLAGAWGAVRIFTSPPAAEIVHWSGGAWHQVGATLLAPAGNALTVNSVAILGPRNVWAGGYESFQTAGFTEQAPMAFHWNGAAWTPVFLPLTGQNQFGFVTRLRAVNGRLWAVGTQSIFAGPSEALMDEFSNGKWTAMTKLPGAFPVGLTDVSGDGQGGVFVSASPLAGPPVGELWEWNGASWVSGVLAPPGGPANPNISDAVSGLAQVPGTPVVWAVGQLSDSGPGWPQPLIDRTG
jgi:hypothetical protein